MKNQQPPAAAIRFHPLGFVLKFDPPIIGLLYHPIENKRVNQKKKKCYTIHLNNLIFLVEPDDIVEQLFQEHPDFLDPEFVKPEQVVNCHIQVFKLVLRLVAYRDHQLRNMQGEDMGILYSHSLEGYYDEEYEEEEIMPQQKGGKRDNNKSF